ncbi:MAG TPA: 3-deoxy-7-phosphoheptulonate synthase, partial [Thermoanaerobaculia bacterium]|nr:3-deoxy-7-phosphoheptulonate synthase [Thermoanaerobaculia bacterium]
MLIVMDAAATAEDVERVVGTVRGLGLQAHPIPGAQRTAIGITGNRGAVDRAAFENLPGVAEVIPVSAPYKLVSREAKRENTVVSIRGVPVGGPRLALVAGPCAVESEAQAIEIGRRVREAGASLYRGGAYKPRTSPYSFQGLGVEGLKILARVRAETGLPIITEVLDTETVDVVAEHADCLQVGARNMQNFSLLKRL